MMSAGRKSSLAGKEGGLTVVVVVLWRVLNLAGVVVGVVTVVLGPNVVVGASVVVVARVVVVLLVVVVDGAVVDVVVVCPIPICPSNAGRINSVVITTIVAKSNKRRFILSFLS
ncbi:MAG: hypothetical protein ACYC56_00510 [Candidatus Aquicultor sp.]